MPEHGIFKINTRKRVKTYHAISEKINAGELQDDYTNHFHSHFGFYDVAHDQDRKDNVVDAMRPDPYYGQHTNHTETRNWNSSKPAKRTMI